MSTRLAVTTARSAPERQMGIVAALAVFALNVTYVVVGLVWFLSMGDLALRPSDPFLAILELLLVLASPLMVVLMAAVHRCAPVSAKAFSLVALSFMILLAGVTCSVHFIDVTVIRQLNAAVLVTLAPVVSRPWRWPSIFFALDLLAWDVFFGLSMLFASQVFGSAPGEAAVRRAMMLSGTFCVIGTLGPLLGDLRIQYLAILGYAFVFPVVCVLLVRVFRRYESSESSAEAGGG